MATATSTTPTSAQGLFIQTPKAVYILYEYTKVWREVDLDREHPKDPDSTWMGDSIGNASALKMCFAAYTKGTTALLSAVLAAAEGLDVRTELDKFLWGARSSIFSLNRPALSSPRKNLSLS
jgi:hypothetical protein